MKTAPWAGAAVSVATVLGGKPVVQNVPQLMALPTPVTVPVPPPTLASVTLSGLLVNVAVTVREALSSTVHALRLSTRSSP